MLTLNETSQHWFYAECIEHAWSAGGARESWVQNRLESHLRKEHHD